jgi:hypothetical protein
VVIERKVRAPIVNASPGQITTSLDLRDYEKFLALARRFGYSKSSLLRMVALAAMENPEYLFVRLAAQELAEAARREAAVPVKVLRP